MYMYSTSESEPARETLKKEKGKDSELNNFLVNKLFTLQKATVTDG